MRSGISLQLLGATLLFAPQTSWAQQTTQKEVSQTTEAEEAAQDSPTRQQPNTGQDVEEAASEARDSAEAEPAALTLEERLAQAEFQVKETQRRNEELERRNEEIELRLEDLEIDRDFNEQRVDSLMPVSTRLSGYVDMGFFYVSGDGRGIRPDTGHEHFPEYDGVVPDSWVFLGDPLSTAINSRGDQADTTESRAVVFDPVHAGNNPTFILNNVNVQFFAGLGKHVTVNAMVDFLPRPRSISNPDGVQLGDYIDTKLGYIEYRGTTKAFLVELSAGKFDSVLGREYRRQEAPDRLTVTPSLICRYTCGRALGLKSRWSFFEKSLVLNAAVTNGSYFVEFFPFSSEIDTNKFKTVGGRLSWALPILDEFEIGVSGAFGAQDFQPEDDVYQKHFGFDLHMEVANVRFSAEFVRGQTEGEDDPSGGPPCALSACLTYQGGYALLGYRANNWFIPYVRGDIRDALLESGASFVYISKDIRTTVGARLEPLPRLAFKGEYTFNWEFGGVPQFPNDIFTTSLVGQF